MAAADGRPRLLNMVAPDIPQRVYDQIGTINEVDVELTVRRDGTVAGVNVLPPVPRPAVRYIVEALQRWRYEPVPSEQVIRVQLIFSGS
jgi:outer membrane biosynthesis protein TonB